MFGSTDAGKVWFRGVITVTRLDSHYVPFDINTTLRCSSKYGLSEEFACCSTSNAALPRQCDSMDVGDKVTFQVRGYVAYTRSYEGEYDFDIYYTRVRKLKYVYAKKANRKVRKQWTKKECTQ